MPLKPAQLTALRTAIFADSTGAAFIASGDVQGLWGWLEASTATLAWLPVSSSINTEEAPSYTGYATMTQGERDSWVLFLSRPRDFGKAKVRNWVTSIWGASTANSNSEKILQSAMELCTKAQELFGGSTESEGSVSALDRTFTGAVDETDVKKLIFKNNGTIWTA